MIQRYSLKQADKIGSHLFTQGSLFFLCRSYCKSHILDPTFRYCRKEEHNNHSKLCPIYGSRVINPYALGPRILGPQTLSPEYFKSQGPEGRGPKIHRTSGLRVGYKARHPRLDPECRTTVELSPIVVLVSDLISDI